MGKTIKKKSVKMTKKEFNRLMQKYSESSGKIKKGKEKQEAISGSIETKEPVNIHELVLDIHKMCVDRELTYGEFFMLASELKSFCETMKEALMIKSEKELLHMPRENLEQYPVGRL